MASIFYPAVIKEPFFEHGVWSCQPVFMLRCCECAEIPGKKLAAFTEWWQLQEALAFYPGWAATSEQHVFCPLHHTNEEF